MIQPRAYWNADDARVAHFKQLGVKLPNIPASSKEQIGIAIHHSATFRDESGGFTIVAVLQSIQKHFISQTTQGYSDIAYSFVIDRDGAIYEGRGWEYKSAATLNCNDTHYSVCFLGDYRTQEVTNSQVAALDELKTQFVAQFNKEPQVLAHSSCTATACPGSNIRDNASVWGRITRPIITAVAEPAPAPVVPALPAPQGLPLRTDKQFVRAVGYAEVFEIIEGQRRWVQNYEWSGLYAADYVLQDVHIWHLVNIPPLPGSALPPPNS